MECLRCGGKQVIKSGFAHAQQRYECKGCHYHFITEHKRDFEEKKVRVIRLYCSGVSFRQIGRLENISPTSVRRWVKQYAQGLPEAGTQAVSVVELDEQWHFLQKNA
jgi:transposase-like protein